MVRKQWHRSIVFLSALSILVGAVFFSMPTMALGTEAEAAVQGAAMAMDAAPTNMPMRGPCPNVIMAPFCVGDCVNCGQIVVLPDASMGLGAGFTNGRATIHRHDKPLGISPLPDPSPPRTSSIA